MDLKDLKKVTRNFRLLYVEDHNDTREAYGEFFSDIFKSVSSASNGIEALDIYKNGNFDLVITDISMPVMDGIKMVEKMKRIDASQKVVVLTAYSEFEYLEKIDKLGINLFLTKPVEISHMVEKIYSILSEREVA